MIHHHMKDYKNKFYPLDLESKNDNNRKWKRIITNTRNKIYHIKRTFNNNPKKYLDETIL